MTFSFEIQNNINCYTRDTTTGNFADAMRFFFFQLGSMHKASGICPSLDFQQLHKLVDASGESRPLVHVIRTHRYVRHT